MHPIFHSAIKLQPAIVQAIVTIIVSLIVSLIVPLIIFSRTKRRENYQNLLERITLYSSPEMLLAIQSLWDFYNKYGDSKFLDQYMKIKEKENKQMEKMNASDKLNYQRCTLHYERRLVSHFWRTMSDLMSKNLVPQKAVYYWWSKDDIDIVKKIIVPIENRLLEARNVPITKKDNAPLDYLLKIQKNFIK
jgi:hypothetical protein